MNQKNFLFQALTITLICTFNLLIRINGLIVGLMGSQNYAAYLVDQRILSLHIRVMVSKFGWNEWR